MSGASSESFGLLGNLSGNKDVGEDTQWEPVRESGNTVLTFEVLQHYLRGSDRSTMQFF